MFNNLAGQVCGAGDLQYLQFDDGGSINVNSITRIHNNHFCDTDEMVQIFIELSLLLEEEVIVPPEQQILAVQGTRPSAANCGRLIAFCPPGDKDMRDGRFVGLSQDDHNVFYDRSESCGNFDLIRGFDKNKNVFTISNCDESTRTPPAPPVN
jgi:hypothetical protein